jgi:hypothetical protein
MAQSRLFLIVKLLLIPCIFALGAFSTLWRFDSWKNAQTVLPQPHLVIPAGQKVLGVVDALSVSKDKSKTNRLRLAANGWAAFSNPKIQVKKMEIFVDKNAVAQFEDFFSRPDVARAYAEPNFEMSGWQIGIDFDGISAGEHVLTFRLTADNGETGSLPPRAFRIE